MPEQTHTRRLSPQERLGKLLVRADVIKKSQVDEALRIHQQHPDNIQSVLEVFRISVDLFLVVLVSLLF